MKRSTIVLLIALVMFLCGVGLTVYGAVAQKDAVGTAVTDELSVGEINRIDIDVLASSVEIKPSSDGKIHLSYENAVFCRYTHTVKDGELKIECKDVIPHVSFGVTTSSKVVLLIPDGMKANIEAELDAGIFTLEDLTLSGKIDVESDAGNVTFKNANAEGVCAKTDVGSVKINNCKFASFDAETDVGSIDIDSLDCRVTSLSSDVGSIKGKLCGKLEDYTVSCRKDMGSCNVSDRVGGDKILKVSTSVGNINITFTESE